MKMLNPALEARRLARLESKLTKLAMYLGIPLDRDSEIPEPRVAHIGYDPEKDEPFIEVQSLHVSLYDLGRLYKQLETRKPVSIQMRGFEVGVFFEPKEL